MISAYELMMTQARLGNSDAFERVFEKYVPVVLSQRKMYYLRDFDLDDWLQEGRIVCYQSLQRYDLKQDVTFGLFFKINFKRRVVTLLRYQGAQKRQIYRYTESLDEQIDQFGDLFSKKMEDYNARRSIEYIFVRDSLKSFSEQLSSFEKLVYIQLLSGKDLEGISEQLKAPLSKVSSAYSRLRKKMIKQITED